MRKTIDFSEEEITKIEEYSTKHGIKTFTESTRSIIREFDDASCVASEGDISDDNFALIADALIQLDNRISSLTKEIIKINQLINYNTSTNPPKSAGEVK